jgi:hypothetical protein
MFFSHVAYTGSAEPGTERLTRFDKIFRPIRSLIKKASGVDTGRTDNVVYMEQPVVERRNTGYAFAHEENYGAEIVGVQAPSF